MPSSSYFSILPYIFLLLAACSPDSALKTFLEEHTEYGTVPIAHHCKGWLNSPYRVDNKSSKFGLVDVDHGTPARLYITDIKTNKEKRYIVLYPMDFESDESEFSDSIGQISGWISDGHLICKSRDIYGNDFDGIVFLSSYLKFPK